MGAGENHFSGYAGGLYYPASGKSSLRKRDRWWVSGRSDGIHESANGIDMGDRSTGGQRQLRRGVGRHQLCDEPDGISQVEIPWKHSSDPADCAGAILL